VVEQDIYGPRYGYNYHGINLCFKCSRNAKKAHYEGHEFEKFTPYGESMGLINP